MSLATLPLAFPLIVAQSGGAALMLVFLAPLALFLLAKGYQSMSRYLLLKHIPTSNCGDVSSGLVELKAEVVSDDPFASPLTDEMVVYCDYTIEEQINKRGDEIAWETIEEGENKQFFYLRDETGRVRVDPTGAEFHPHLAVEKRCEAGHSLYERGPAPAENATGRRRYREEHIAVGQEVYVLGTAGAHENLAVPEICAGDGDQPFIISTTDESGLVSKFRAYATGFLFLGTLMAITIPVLALLGIGHSSFGEALEMAVVPTFVIGLGIVCLIWALYRMKHSEHLEDLKRRVDRALEMLRRQGARRERLVAKIAHRVSEHSDDGHREQLQALVAERRQRTFTGGQIPSVRRVCSTIDEQSDALEEIFSVAANYPDLKSDQSFYDLLEELTRCEKQIMMSRNFYNEGIWRIDREPEAATGELSYSSKAKRTAFTFEAFERKPFAVVLPEDPEGEYAGQYERPVAESPEIPEATPPSSPQEASAVEIDEALESPEVLMVDEPDVDGGASMRFGSSQGFGDVQGFGDIRRFGKSRSFDDLCEEQDRKKGKKREHFGFTDADRRSVLDAFSQDD